MVDLRKIPGKAKPKLAPKTPEKVLADQLGDDLNEQIKDVRSRNKTAKSDKLDSSQGSIFDFLLDEKYHLDFLELLKLNQTLSDPNNTKSKQTLLSQKKLLSMVKGFQPDNELLQQTPQSSFYKWLCRNGLGTKQQITNYYVSRSKEVANSLKRRVIIEELIDDLGNRPELIQKLFTFEEFKKQLKTFIEHELKS